MQTEQPTPTILGKYAGFITRLIAFVIDALILFVTITTISLVANFLLDFLRAQDTTRRFVNAILIIVNTTIFIGYPVTFWALAGQTPGKALMGVRIVRTDGERLQIGRAFIRLLGYWVSSILFLGYLWVLVDGRRQAFHDKLADTFVVYSWPESALETQPSRPIRDRADIFKRRRQAAAKQE